MNRFGKLLMIVALLALPLAMAGCPAEEDTGGAPVVRPSSSASPSGGTGIGGKIG